MLGECSKLKKGKRKNETIGNCVVNCLGDFVSQTILAFWERSSESHVLINCNYYAGNRDWNISSQIAFPIPAYCKFFVYNSERSHSI